MAVAGPLSLRALPSAAWFLAALLLIGSWQASAATTEMTTLLARVVERNAIADQVALSKWDSGKPVLDAEREQAVLQSVRAQAPVHGLESELAARFFAAQIEANKLVQYQLLQRWQLRGHAPQRPRPDLVAVRGRLDQLQGELLAALAQSESLRQRSDCKAVSARAIDDYARQLQLDGIHRLALSRALGDLCSSP